MGSKMISAANAALSISDMARCKQDAMLLAFNRQPSRYLHRSRRGEFVAAPLSDFLFDGALAHPHLSAYIRQQAGLDDIRSEDAARPAVRIAMQLNDGRLEALAHKIGLALMGRPIRLAISGDAVNAWIAALGDPLFRFAYRHAPLLNPAPVTPLPGHLTLLDPTNAMEQSAAAGLQLLDAASVLLEASIGRRLRFQLPREIAPKIDMRIDPNHYSEVWTWIDRIWNCMPMRVSPSLVRNPAAYK
ncbi:hypothetical protein D9O50_04525 [Oxalobacteraceae bacterium CAVE-383]|nr:hypothetical protein D9O50_04525 [Oxalobacteraceae bacterium CAVE-383]